MRRRGRTFDHLLDGWGPDDLTYNDKKPASAPGQLQETASPFRHRCVTLPWMRLGLAQPAGFVNHVARYLFLDHPILL
jgi:hypothetical protein